jgi:broad specificity phosphatase PhoE
MALVYLIQHGDTQRLPGDPGLTATGRHQAALTGRWLLDAGLRALYTSPLRRARETADRIGAVTGLPVQLDARLGERMNWDGACSLEDFLADWVHATRDRDFVPSGGQSSRQAGERLHAFVAGLPARLAPVGAVTHGGVTTDLLRNLRSDYELPAGLLEAGIPPCAVTTIEDLNVVSIAAAGHLAEAE